MAMRARYHFDPFWLRSGWRTALPLAPVLAIGGLAWGPAAGLGQSAGEARPAAGPRFVVVLDAAHGGDDGGGRVGSLAGAAEKTVTLALSVRLRSLLTARGFTVATTREGNVNVSADARAQIANHATAEAVSGPGIGAACLSLHASQAGSGVHIFVSSLAESGPSRFLPWKTAQSAYVSRSLKLAGTVNSALEHSSVAGGGDSPGASGAGDGSGSASGVGAASGFSMIPEGVWTSPLSRSAARIAPVTWLTAKSSNEATSRLAWDERLLTPSLKQSA